MRKPQPRQAKGTPSACKGCGQKGNETTRCQLDSCGWSYCPQCAQKQTISCGHCGKVTCVVCTVIYVCNDVHCLRCDEEYHDDRSVCRFCVYDNMCGHGGCEEIAYPCCAPECVDCGLSFCEDHITGRCDFDYVFLCDGCCEERVNDQHGDDEDEGGEGNDQKGGE